MTNSDEHDTLPPSMDPAADSGIVDPPSDFFGILRRLGPGLIIAGSIVGSGELIATTKTGAMAGISLLWLIIVGCMIKVFVQIELGRYAITHGETTLSALDRVPGPYLSIWRSEKGGRFSANWIVWCWAAMAMCSIGQLGGIVGGVGQALAITFPINGDYLQHIQSSASDGDLYTLDDKLWAGLVAVITAAVLYVGRYRFIQNISTIFVVSFTFITIGNVISLQQIDTWRISAEELWQGLSFGLPDKGDPKQSLTTALAAFGIIGVGASELVAYPYWCLEKGYAKFTGVRTDDENWARRARGWMRVMLWDALASMVIYTIATLAFFLMGVAVLHRQGLDPDGMRMVSTLAEAYAPVFGEYAKWLFLIGAIAVLYSTYLVANAGNARMVTDALKVLKLIARNDERVHQRAVSTLSVILPLLCFVMFLTGANPVTLVLIAGAMQATLLPMLGIGALYFRYTRTDSRLKPTLLWDVLLILSCVGLLVAGAWGVYSQFS